MLLGFDRRDILTTYNLLRMNIRDRYLGSTLGSIWGIANPLLMMGIFTFVFGYVYKIRLPGAETTLSYVTWLIVGYGPWIATTESITAAAGSVVAASALIKNLAFKTEVLPIAGTMMGMLPLAISLIFALVLLVIDGNIPTIHAISIPLVVVLQLIFLNALGLFLSGITVFIRDVMHIIPNLLMMLLFGTPIFYPIESMPRVIKVVSHFNPFYLIAEGYRQPLLYHQFPEVFNLLYLALLSLGLNYIGIKFFRRIKGFFESAL